MTVVAVPDAWTEAPLPAHNVIEGEPRTRSHDLYSAWDGGVSMNYWDCTAGRFKWDYLGDEMVQILEGEVHVTFEDGVTRILREGDTAHFKAGTTLEWYVPDYVRKVAFHRSPQSLPDRIFLKAMRILRRLPGLERRRHAR